MLVNITKNEDGTLTYKWKEFANETDHRSWGGDFTGVEKEETFKPEEINIIDSDNNIVHIRGGKIIYNIEPAELIFFAHAMEEMLPNLKKVTFDWFNMQADVRTMWINLDNVFAFIKGDAYVPNNDSTCKAGVIAYKHSSTVTYLTKGEMYYFEPILNEYRDKCMGREKEENEEVEQEKVD